jgi:RNA polymerase sigma-70 factor (ECF subfamily)
MLPATFSSVRSEMLAKEFEGLFLEHYQMVYRTAYSVTGSRQDAEDVLQSLFLKLLQLESPPDRERSLKGYLYRAAINLSLNIVRARKRRDETEDVDSLAAPEPSHYANERQRRLMDAVAQLPPRAVEILILRYEHDYSDAEIAKMLGTSRGSIAVTLYRTRTRLKRLLRSSGDNS